MTRLVVFILSVLSLVVALSLTSYRDLNVSQSKFNYEAAKKSYEARKEELKKLAEMQRPKKLKVEESSKPKGPIIVLDTEELKNGAKIYRTCVSCHGKFAEGKKSQKAPKLAGQFKDYLEEQIHLMQSGKRVNKVMNPYIKRLTDKDISDVAAYLAKYPW